MSAAVKALDDVDDYVVKLALDALAAWRSVEAASAIRSVANRRAGSEVAAHAESALVAIERDRSELGDLPALCDPEGDGSIAGHWEDKPDSGRRFFLFRLNGSGEATSTFDDEAPRRSFTFRVHGGEISLAWEGGALRTPYRIDSERHPYPRPDTTEDRECRRLVLERDPFFGVDALTPTDHHHVFAAPASR